MKIIISAESTIDMPKELLKKYGIETTPFGIYMGEDLVEDRFGISSEIFDYVEKTKTLPKTSAISPEQYKEHFTKLKQNGDAIVHISLSSCLSSAYNNACMAAKEVGDIYVLDSRTLSTGIALLAIYASELAKKAKNAEEVYEKTKEKITSVQASFIIEKLNYLHKGGRCSALALLGANLLKIKPQINLVNGKMVVAKKYVGGTNKVLSKYCDELLEANNNPELDTVFITSSSPMEDIHQSLEEKLKARGFKNVYHTLAGGTISSHCGPNCLGVLFLNK